MEFFKEENHKVVIDKKVKLIKAYNALVVKDKDRKKRNATAWFAYVYYHTDFRSPYVNESPPSEKHATIVKNVENLEEGFKVFPELLAAIEKYKEWQMTPKVKSLTSLRSALVTTSRVIDMTKNRIEDKMAVLETGEDLEEETITSIISQVNKMLELSDKLPKAISTITALEEEVKKEQSGDSKLRGGVEKGAFED